jgi:hypothetical protein
VEVPVSKPPKRSPVKRGKRRAAGKAIVSWLVALAIALILVPIGVHLLLWAMHSRSPLPRDPISLAMGCIFGVGFVVWRRPSELWHVMAHEACHAIACVCTGTKIHRFQASDSEGGAVVHAAVGPVREAAIALAPYVLPLLLAPALVVRWWLIPQKGVVAAVFSGICGFLVLPHVVGLVLNVKRNCWTPDADLARVGRVLSLVVIVLAQVLLLTALLIVLWPHRS